jgi:hypothetical protein
MSTDVTDPRTPNDAEATFLAEMDAAVSGWPVRDGSELLATATRVRDLATRDPRASLDPVRQQEIWGRIMAGQGTAQTTHGPAGQSRQRTRLRSPQRPMPPAPRHRSWLPGGWLATAVAICLLALLAVPLAREVGLQGHATSPAQIPAQTRDAQFGSGGDNAAGSSQVTTPPAVAPTQTVPSADGGMLAPPSTVIATMPPNLTVTARVSVADPHQLLFQLEQNNGISYDWENRRRANASVPIPYHAIPWTPSGDTDLNGSVGGVEIVQEGHGDQPLAGYIIFAKPEQAAQRLTEVEQTPGLVMEKTRVDQYDGVIVLNNDRVTTIVQVGNVLVVGNAWTSANDWMSTEADLQAFRWQSLEETITAIAYLDHVVSAYQGHR